jgi:NCAIR mutase (PurE)-related protein
MPFRTRPGQPRDLIALIEGELRERIEDALDSVSLDVMAQRRRARGLPPPAADSGSDREEFTAGVRAFLERLGTELLREATAEQKRKAAESASRAGGGELGRLLAVQVTLARELPDYWQRFETLRVAYTAECLGSRGE